MKVLLTAALIAMSTALSAACVTPARAQGWCARSDANEGGQTCGFATVRQCYAYLRGLGGICQRDFSYRRY